VHIVVEEVLNCGDQSQRLQLVPVAPLDRLSVHSGLCANLGDTLNGLDLILGVEGRLSLVVPELPTGLQSMTLLRKEDALLAQWLA
jgi:hypothetical protein